MFFTNEKGRKRESMKTLGQLSLDCVVECRLVKLGFIHSTNDHTEKDKQAVAILSYHLHPHRKPEAKEKKMAQTLAMPVAPSLSAICNGLSSISLSNRLSFPTTNPLQVILLSLSYWVFENSFFLSFKFRIYFYFVELKIMGCFF